MDADAADQLAIHDLAIAYATTADERDAAGFTALFLPDATLTARRGAGEGAVYAGAERLAEIPRRLGRYDQTFHVVTNHRVEVDGDSARGVALCQAHHLTRDPPPGDGPNVTDLVLAIRYTDAYRRTADGWRFATRDVHILWSSEGPVTIG